MNKCTVSVAGGICGQPAVTSFKGQDGKRYHECAAHAPKLAVKAPAASRRIRPRPDGLDVPVGWRMGRDFPE